MQILIVRHGDPDYENDTLTELGHRQARALSEVLEKHPIQAIYSSPYGRAKDTARYTAEKLELSVEELQWIREMNDIVVPSKIRDDLAVWHIPPMEAAELQNGKDSWMDNSIFKPTLLKKRIKEMEEGTDNLLSQYGISREGKGFRFEKSLKDFGDIAVFCHQGAGITWIAHLLGICPIELWRSTYVSPTSVTTLLFEESEAETNWGTFRMVSMGSTAHLLQSQVEDNRSGLLYNPF